MDMLFSDSMLGLWSALGAAVGTLLLMAAMLWAGRLFTGQARALWRAVRGQRAAVIAAVDEPTDPLIARLGQAGPVPAAVWAAFLPAFFSALADGLDQALGEQAARE